MIYRMMQENKRLGQTKFFRLCRDVFNRAVPDGNKNNKDNKDNKDNNNSSSGRNNSLSFQNPTRWSHDLGPLTSGTSCVPPIWEYRKQRYLTVKAWFVVCLSDSGGLSNLLLSFSLPLNASELSGIWHLAYVSCLCFCFVKLR